MRHTITVALTLLLFITDPLLAASTAGYAAVFVYHKFGEPESPTTSVSMEEFDAQLRYLRDNGYNVIGLPELVSLVGKGGEIPQKTVAITIDDGYRSVYSHAFPLLKKYGFPFTLFLYMEAVGRYPDYLTVDELLEIKAYGKATFGNHSYSHRRLARWPEGMSTTQYLRWLEEDLLKSERRFERLLGFKPEFYAFPYGEYNREFVELIKRRGYRASFTQDPASTGSFSDLHLLPRYASVGSWALMDKFREFLSTEPLHVDRIRPPYGILDENPPDRIEGRIIGHERYKNFGIYVSELGWLRPEVHEESGRVTIKPSGRLQRKTNRIGFTAVNTETGRTAAYFYMILLRE